MITLSFSTLTWSKHTNINTVMFTLYLNVLKDIKVKGMCCRDSTRSERSPGMLAGCPVQGSLRCLLWQCWNMHRARDSAHVPLTAHLKPKGKTYVRYGVNYFDYTVLEKTSLTFDKRSSIVGTFVSQSWELSMFFDQQRPATAQVHLSHSVTYNTQEWWLHTTEFFLNKYQYKFQSLQWCQNI